jgi:restriction system protein
MGDTMKLNEVIDKNCISIDESCNYWLVRTDGGNLFDPFYRNGVISLGYQKISIDQIYGSISDSEQKTVDNLRQLAIENYPEHERPGLIASQIARFTFEIRNGDYVVIPDLSTERLAIGIVEEDRIIEKKLYIDDSDEKTLIPEFNKTKKVKWLKTVVKRHINPNLYKLFFSHQAIASANEYSKYIDGMLFDFYKKNDEYHLIIDISKSEIPAFALFKTYVDLIDVTEKYCTEYGFDQNINDINISVNLDSPGKLELWGKRVGIAIFIIGGLIVGINGGGFKLKIEKLGIDSEITTPGLIKTLNDYLDSAANREIKKQLSEKVRTLAISDPEQIMSMLSSITKQESVENKKDNN